MRILFVAPRFHTNQVPIVDVLLNNNHVVQFHVFYKGATEDYSTLEPIVIRPALFYKIRTIFRKKRMSDNQLESSYLKMFRPSMFFVLGRLINFRPDLVILRDYVFATKLYNVLCNLLGIHNTILYTQKPCYKLKNENANNEMKTRLVDKWIKPKLSISPVLFERASQLINESDLYTFNDRFEFVPFISNAPAFKAPRSYFLDNKINILSIGKFRDYKNHYCLVNAINLLSESEKSRIHVTIIGQSYNRDEIQYLDRLNLYIQQIDLSDIIKTKSNIEYKDIGNYYLKNDVFVLASKREVASISVLEAMSYGLLTISSDINGTATYIDPNKCGFIFHPDKPEELTALLSRIINQSELIPQMGHEAVEHMIRHYSPSNYLSRIENIYSKINMMKEVPIG